MDCRDGWLVENDEIGCMCDGAEAGGARAGTVCRIFVSLLEMCLSAAI